MKFIDQIKIGSLDRNDLSKGFLEALTFVQEDYTDNSLEEHLYNIDDLGEEIDSELYSFELAVIKKLCDKHNCSYFRIVNS